MLPRLERMAEFGNVPFHLDFLRELGFRVGQDYDGELLIVSPPALDVLEVEALLRRFEEGIQRSLRFERERLLAVCVGGPNNGEPHGKYFGCPIVRHVGRAQWAVYHVRSHEDPRASYVGMATNKKKARALWFAAHQAAQKDR